MALQVFARNIQDASLNPATFALPASASTSTTSAVIDLGTDVYKTERLELDLLIPALSTTIAPDTRTVTAIIETSTTSVFTAVDATIFSKILTGAGGAGIGIQNSLRCRVPSNCAQYVRAKVTFGASTTDGSAVSATFTPRF
jgi:hypothetical protein